MAARVQTLPRDHDWYSAETGDILMFHSGAVRRLPAPLAQLDRASGYGPGGWGFESSRARFCFSADDLQDARFRNGH